MSRKVFTIIAVVTVLASVAVYFLTRSRTQGMTLTGIVTTDNIAVSAQVQGRLTRLLVKDGDTVAAGQLLAVLAPEELRADERFYAASARSSAAAVDEAQAALRFQERQTRDQVRQAEAQLAAGQASVAQAEAQLEQARLDAQRADGLFQQGIVSSQAHDQARTTLDAARAQVQALRKQVAAQKAALALAQSSAEQIAVRKSQLAAGRHQLAAARAQKQAAQVRVDYTQVRSPIAGLVALRAALQGEVVSPGQPIVELYNPDNLWVRADVEETYIDRIRLGERLPVRFPGGLEREGTVYFRGVDAEYATQRDVSRTKRDIKTFEIRLRVDNRDRRLAPGLTAFVELPFGKGS